MWNVEEIKIKKRKAIEKLKRCTNKKEMEKLSNYSA